MRSNRLQIIRRPFGILRAVVRRLRMWRKVKANLSGYSAADVEVLDEAINKRLMTVWQNLDQWQFPMADSDCVVESKGIGIFRVRGRTDDLFHALPMQEPAVEKTIRSLLLPGDTFVDAGANIGFYTILASQLVGDLGQVVSFEMMPTTASILRSHVEINTCLNVDVIEGALAERSGLAVNASVVDGRSGRSSIAGGKTARKIEVKTVSLSEELKEVSSVQLLKMDLEGAELGALMGADLEKMQAIVFENGGDTRVLSYLESDGFVVERLDSKNFLAQRKR